MIKPLIRSSHGFTLVELAVALLIIALLLGSILTPLTKQVEQKQISDTQKKLDDIRDALLGYVVAFGNLPCPDTDNDGIENVNAVSGQCSSFASNIAAGNLPWQTLGVASADVWGNRFRYIVREQFARRSPEPSFTLSNTASVRVCPTAATCGASLTSSAVLVIVSHGKNGYGATNSINGATNPAPASNDELENTDNDRDFVSRIITAQGATAGEFDDIVTWLPLYTLFNRMVAAGKLP